MRTRILAGDCRELLATLDTGSVQTCVTSPPYFQLRDYNVPGQIGLEPDVSAYVAALVDVFRAVKRVLRDDGTLFINLGDSYAGKQLLGVPWRVAFALQADGWILRSDVIWHKPNPMPESVRDRPTKSHEYLFLLSKAPRYFYDAAAIAEPFADERMGASGARSLPYSAGSGRHDTLSDGVKQGLGVSPSAGARNKRSVWTITPKPFRGAHFATFPPALIEPCIKAGTSERGHCPACGAPWVRVVEHIGGDTEAHARPKRTAGMASRTSTLSLSGNGSKEWAERGSKQRTVGWAPSCACDAGDPVPDVVLDPFGGAGTTALVANRLGRDAILVELNPEYAAMARRRIANDAPLLSEAAD